MRGRGFGLPTACGLTFTTASRWSAPIPSISGRPSGPGPRPCKWAAWPPRFSIPLRRRCLPRFTWSTMTRTPRVLGETSSARSSSSTTTAGAMPRTSPANARPRGPWARGSASCPPAWRSPTARLGLGAVQADPPPLARRPVGSHSVGSSRQRAHRSEPRVGHRRVSRAAAVVSPRALRPGAPRSTRPRGRLPSASTRVGAQSARSFGPWRRARRNPGAPGSS